MGVKLHKPTDPIHINDIDTMKYIGKFNYGGKSTLIELIKNDLKRANSKKTIGLINITLF